MGKKRIIKQTEAEILKEGEKVDEKIEKTARKAVSSATRERVPRGRAYIKSSYNNIIITVTDPRGGVLAWASSGSLGFRGAKKATPFAASRVAEAVCEKVKKTGMNEVGVYIRGIGSGRDSAIRSLEMRGLRVTYIKDITPVPHNGCRPPKRRRV